LLVGDLGRQHQGLQSHWLSWAWSVHSGGLAPLLASLSSWPPRFLGCCCNWGCNAETWKILRAGCANGWGTWTAACLPTLLGDLQRKSKCYFWQTILIIFIKFEYHQPHPFRKSAAKLLARRAFSSYGRVKETVEEKQAQGEAVIRPNVRAGPCVQHSWCDSVHAVHALNCSMPCPKTVFWTVANCTYMQVAAQRTGRTCTPWVAHAHLCILTAHHISCIQVRVGVVKRKKIEKTQTPLEISEQRPSIQKRLNQE